MAHARETSDNRISILGSYVKSGKGGITNDVEALKSAGKGISTKNLPDTENRGYLQGTGYSLLSISYAYWLLRSIYGAPQQFLSSGKTGG